MAVVKPPIPRESIEPVKRPSRSRFDEAVRSMNTWSEEDRQIFVSTFASGKSGSQVASELGITLSTLQMRRRSILRRFMYGADSLSAA